MLSASLVCLALAMGQSVPKDERPRHPLAPSLPLLTEKEMAHYEAIIDRFIQYDIGKLPKPEGKKALDDFNRLPSESIFALVDGFNRAANFEHSCPAVIIGRKIEKILLASEDFALLSYAKDNIGLGVKARRHQGTVQTLQVTCIARKGFLQRQGLAAASARPAPPRAAPLPASSLALMSPFELSAAAKKEQGIQLKAIIAEAEKRKLVDVLAIAAARPESEAKELAQTAFDKSLAGESAERLKKLLKHEKVEVRAASARSIGQRELRLGGELIDALSDASPTVQQAARGALVRLSGGRDFGPETDAGAAQGAESIRRWRAWWSTAK
jgi:hypothetical protein